MQSHNYVLLLTNCYFYEAILLPMYYNFYEEEGLHLLCSCPPLFPALVFEGGVVAVLCPSERYGEILTLNTCKHDLMWTWGFCRCHLVKMRSH